MIYPGHKERTIHRIDHYANIINEKMHENFPNIVEEHSNAGEVMTESQEELEKF